ncbi:hypothetical protein GGR54DRAFT_59445 [Hypoxylon sp. NC1633]|nr:hypothetical protein GGR54DRAFT_59445 [Hypoxylon sp. NC1633]
MRFLRWTLSQLCQQSQVIPSLIWKTYDKHLRPTLEGLLSSLEDSLKGFDAVYITLDAVDESEERLNLLGVIHRVSTELGFEKTRLFVTSREYFNIKTVMEQVSTHFLMSNPLVEEDIKCYVSAKLKSSQWVRPWSLGLREEIEDALAEGAKGIFRWAVCQRDILRRLRTTDKIRDLLRHLPEDLDKSYQRILSLIPEEDKVVVRHTMRFPEISTKAH